MHTLFRLRNAAAGRVRTLLLAGVGAWLLAGLLPSESVAQDTGEPLRDSPAARADSAAAPRDSILPLATGYEQLRARYRSFQPLDSAAAARAAGGASALTLDGLVVDETRTRLGRTFYRIFYQRWEAPEEKVVVGVYRFRDQTGQYKPSEQGISYSTAVTQGATSILIDALSESGWFVPIERAGLSNLLNERQIIQQVRQCNQGPDGEPIGQLPPLLYAGVILEGGIIGYDTNVLTGGVGARYFGTGASGQFRKDRVTIYLRAVSTQSGRVLKTVHTTKTIYSQRLDGSFFRFVAADRILEAEVGYSANEPATLAVTAAIDEAVRSLVVEGVRDENPLWALQSPSDSTSAPFRRYDRQRRDAAARNVYGLTARTGNRPGLSLGFSGAAMRYEGDYRDPLTRPGGSVSLGYGLTDGFSLRMRAGYGETAADSAFSHPHFSYDAQARYYALPEGHLSPFVSAGAGALFQQQEDAGADGSQTELFPYLTGGAGVEYLPSPQVGLHLSLHNTYPLREGLDGFSSGRVHDNFWSLRAGLTYYTDFSF